MHNIPFHLSHPLGQLELSTQYTNHPPSLLSYSHLSFKICLLLSEALPGSLRLGEMAFCQSPKHLVHTDICHILASDVEGICLYWFPH